MNRRKLIELLNLYIDDEIDADDLARLERTVSRDAEARRLYQQYCQLDSATRQAHREYGFLESITGDDESDKTAVASTRWGRRIRRVTVVAGSVAASIALVSGFLIVFGPASADTQPETVASAPAKATSANTYLALMAPGQQSFNSDTAIFTLEPAGDGTLVPAAWKPKIELPETIGFAARPPEASAVGGGIQWNAQQSPSLPFTQDPRVYRGAERQISGNFEAVSYQFQK